MTRAEFLDAYAHFAYIWGYGSIMKRVKALGWKEPAGFMSGYECSPESERLYVQLCERVGL